MGCGGHIIRLAEDPHAVLHSALPAGSGRVWHLSRSGFPHSQIQCLNVHLYPPLPSRGPQLRHDEMESDFVEHAHAGMWYYLSLFYSEKDMGMAYAWITTGTALSQVLQHIACSSCSLVGACLVESNFRGSPDINMHIDPHTLMPACIQHPRAKKQAKQCMSAVQVIGSPIAAALLSLDGWLGLEGWQWLFLAEGLPTILLGTYLPRCICDSPAKASFLTPQERNWLVERNVSESNFSCLKPPNCPSDDAWTDNAANDVPGKAY